MRFMFIRVQFSQKLNGCWVYFWEKCAFGKIVEAFKNAGFYQLCPVPLNTFFAILIFSHFLALTCKLFLSFFQVGENQLGCTSAPTP